MDYTKADLESLADKLDTLDLTDGEKTALVAVFGVAADHDEVSGFAYDLNPNDVSFKALVGQRGFNIGMPPTRSIGSPTAGRKTGLFGDEIGAV